MYISLPKELQFNILFYLSYEETINYALTCKSTFLILNDKYFWRKKLKKRLDLPLKCTVTDKDFAQLFDLIDIQPHIRYYNIIKNISNNSSTLYNIISNSIKDNDLSMVNFLVNNLSFPIIDLYKSSLLVDALSYSDVDMVKFMIEFFSPNQEEYAQIFDGVMREKDYHTTDVITSAERGDYYFSNNKNNYDIIEYLLTNSKFNYGNLETIIWILLSFPLSQDKFQRILQIGDFDANDLILSLVGCTFEFTESNIIRTKVNYYYLISISFLEWLLNNYDFKKEVIYELCESLFNDNWHYYQDIYIKRIIRTGKLDSCI